MKQFGVERKNIIIVRSKGHLQYVTSGCVTSGQKYLGVGFHRPVVGTVWVGLPDRTDPPSLYVRNRTLNRSQTRFHHVLLLYGLKLERGRGVFFFEVTFDIP